MIEFYHDLLRNPWTPVAIAAIGGYGLRYVQNIINDLRWDIQERREQRQKEYDTQEINRILEGIEVASEPTTKAITRSPLATLLDAPDWGPAGFPQGPRHAAEEWPGDQKPEGSWWQRWKQATRPRTAEEVAQQVYDDIKVETGVPVYRARHSADGYSDPELTVILTSTCEIPGIRRLVPSWDEVSVPQPVEVFT